MFNSSVARDSKARYVVKFRQQFADMLHIDGNPISYLLPYRAAVAARHAAMADHAMEKAAATVAMQQHTTIGSGTMQQWHQAIKNNTVSAVPKRRLSLSAKASNYMVWTKLLDDQQRPYYYNQSELPVACCLLPVVLFCECICGEMGCRIGSDHLILFFFFSVLLL